MFDDDIIRKMLMPAKIFLYILQAYMVVDTITKFRDSSLCQWEVKVEEILQTPSLKMRSKKHTQNRSFSKLAFYRVGSTRWEERREVFTQKSIENIIKTC